MLSFPPFRLDVTEEQLWKESKLLAVRRKPFAILRYLVTNPRRLVTHDELLREVWGGSVVSESSVRSHLHELRQVLGEGLIETVIGRGYRFTGEVTRGAAPAAPAAPAPIVGDRLVVGREDELRVLKNALDRAHTGHRQVVFVTGEPGIGKTTLVDAFLDSISDAFILRGACIEQHSTPEAYRPIIEMLGQLRHGKHADETVALLVRHAPAFLSQVPQLAPDAKLDEVMRRGAGGSEAKVARELVEMFEAVSMHTTHVLVIEDVQWSDVATIDLLSLLGQRRERAKLLVIATSRRAEAQTVSHPLNRVMRALVARSGAVALPVDRLEDVGAYLTARFPGQTFTPAFVDTIENITAGTPLFLSALLDDLVARDMLAAPVAEIAAHRPDGVKQLIDIQLDRLTTQEQRALEAASLVGAVFPTALVAAALEVPVETADELCDSLARRALFLRHEGTEDWPDGSQQSCYGFTHGLVRDVCAGRSAPARRQRWYRSIAQCLEAAYGTRTDEVSAELAAHYEQAGFVPRAIDYHIIAGERMVARFASADALPWYRHALELLNRVPDGRERDSLELRILGGMSSAVLRQRYAGTESVSQFERMIALADKLGDQTSRIVAMSSLSVRLATLARYREADVVNAELLALGRASQGLDAARALSLFWQGKLAETIAILEPLTRPDTAVEPDHRMGILDPVARKTVLISYLGAAYWVAGRPDDAIAEISRAHRIALESGDPYTIGLSGVNLARLHALRRDPVARSRVHAEQILARSDSFMWHSQAMLLVEWARSTDAPLSRAEADEMQARFRDRFVEIPMGASFVAIQVIAALERSERAADALALADEILAYARSVGELLFEPELVRIRCRLQPDAEMLRTAYANARAMNSHSIALRVALDLGDEALVAEALPRIAGGRDAPDVLDAERFLALRS